MHDNIKHNIISLEKQDAATLNKNSSLTSSGKTLNITEVHAVVRGKYRGVSMNAWSTMWQT